MIRQQSNPDARRLLRTRAAAPAALVLLLLLAPAGWLAGCAHGPGGRSATTRHTVYPPAPQPPRAVALGNLRSGPPPSDVHVRLAEFFFGEEPEPPLAFIRPLSVSPDGDNLIVCDAALASVLHWDTNKGDLAPLRLDPRPAQPVAAFRTPRGELLVADAKAAAIFRHDATGLRIGQYALPVGEFRPAAILLRDAELWVANAAAHRIEIFATDSGEHLRSIGQRGAADGEFGTPLGLAALPDGRVAVADMLNCRVQVLDHSGRPVARIGAPGNRVGTFGRPRGVAVGPDGTVFVVDAASQRIHAFDADGRPLLAFGEPTSAVGGLSVPGGICITRTCPLEAPPLPGDFVAEYYVLVAEQLLRPGVRVYAWGRSPSAEAAAAQRELRPRPTSAGAENPHWSATQCSACHVMHHGRADRLAAASVDQLCLGCHDGTKARMEAHPVGRLAETRGIVLPAGWPSDNGRLACLSCHDIQRHCDPAARRPAVNAAMLRAFDPDDRLYLCLQCHQQTESWRISPHRNLNASRQVVTATCTFCHTRTPEITADGARRGTPQLHAEGSALCLTCHAKHWDVSPRGHVDRPVNQHAAAADADDAALPVAATPARVPPHLPLSDNRVTCYTCHNPHQPGLFPPASPLGAVSDDPADAHAALRTPSATLCLQCHAK